MQKQSDNRNWELGVGDVYSFQFFVFHSRELTEEFKLINQGLLVRLLFIFVLLAQRTKTQVTKQGYFQRAWATDRLLMFNLGLLHLEASYRAFLVLLHNNNNRKHACKSQLKTPNRSHNQAPGTAPASSRKGNWLSFLCPGLGASSGELSGSRWISFLCGQYPSFQQRCPCRYACLLIKSGSLA